MLEILKETVLVPSREEIMRDAARHLRLTEKVNKLEVGKIIDELMCRKPLKGGRYRE